MRRSGLCRALVRAASVAVAATALLVTSITPASAHDWDDDDRYYGYDRYDRGYYGGRGHGYRDYRHGGKHRRYYRDHDRHYYREPRATIVLPLPPPPPFFFPRVVVGHRHHHGCGH